MKIEKPDWDTLKGSSINSFDYHVLDTWFQENVEPVNKMLAEGVEVYGHKEADHPFWYMFENPSESSMKSHTHKALLINIQEIKPKTREEKVKDLIDETYDLILKQPKGYIEKIRTKQLEAKAILEDK